MSNESALGPQTPQTEKQKERVFNRTLLLLLFWAVLPWPLVWISFYNFHAFWMAILSYAGIVCCFPALILHFRKVEYARPSFFFKYSHRSAFEILLLILLTLAVVEGGWIYFKSSMLDWQRFPNVAESIGIRLDLMLTFLVTYFIILNPIVEEFFWRGLVYERLKGSLPMWGAVLLSSLLFGSWHWVIIQYFFTPGWQILLTLLICVGGVLFALLYERSKSLLPSILVHGLGADLAIMLILWDALHTKP